MDTIDCPRCGQEHDPSGCHEEDSGDMTCEACGFGFVVEIEYSPSYNTSCEKHQYGDVAIHTDGETKYRACSFCGSVKLENEANQ